MDNNTILLVDDERWVRIALKMTIEKLNMPFTIVEECNNGLEALDWIKANKKVDLVLTDVRMPIMDGLALTRELQDLADAPDIIIISVHDDFLFLQEALRSGVFDYLLKPVETEDIKLCLDKWLKRHNVAKNIPAQPEIAAEQSSPIAQVLKYINETPPGDVTLAEAAKKVHMNPSYLSQLFKQHMNQNFVDYLMEVRIKEAKRLLSSTSLRISDISERLGYADLPYFSNIFKRVTGITPSEYRNRTGKIIKSS